MRLLFRTFLFSALLFVFGCKSTKQTMDDVHIDEKGVANITPATMNKDAIRLKGEILKSNGEQDNRNSYDFRVDEVLKYGGTFSSAEPAVGEIVKLTTPKSISFKEGQEVVIDVLTPRFNQGDEPMRVRMGAP